MNEEIYEYYDVLTDAELGELFAEFQTRYSKVLTTENFVDFLDLLDEKGLVIERIDCLQHKFRQ